MQALILVDIQNDFMPGGPLGVPDGERVIPVANELAARFDLVVATQDWHPPDHLSFVCQHEGMSVGDVIEVDGLRQILWPEHCIQYTRGAELVAELNQPRITTVIQKGTDRKIDSYSGFFDNGHRQATALEGFLRTREVDTVYLAGVATDYCIRFTALDASRLGFTTYVVRDGCRGVKRAPGDVDRAVQEMESAGVRIVDSKDVPKA